MDKPLTTAEVVKRLEKHYPEVLTADGFEDAIIGLAEGWFGHAHHTVVCYDYAKCVKILQREGHMTAEEAEEYLQFNTLGAYVGEYTPVFLYRWR